MIRHIALFRWKDGVTADQVDHLCTVLDGFPATVPDIKAYSFGADALGEPGNHDFAIVAEFDDADGYRRYRDDAGHKEIQTTVLRPLIAERVAVQVAF
ncbi:Dabb family protein [Jiangella asiatica]|uniref:Dabb family protein n=1 Tax=Jiangella asiatica TaxID=2530372 RepID=A0A4R5D930_9ACTN|nr:Dabb family protein [Jiangella asiatica]TDE08251.1 Dabb family protein [Jiangella asiatica]